VASARFGVIKSIWSYKQWAIYLMASDDAQDENITHKQELMLLAGPSDTGFFRNELIKLLQAKQKEKEEMQQQCVERVHQWQQTVAPPP
jgi:hypothetical protein